MASKIILLSLALLIAASSFFLYSPVPEQMRDENAYKVAMGAIKFINTIVIQNFSKTNRNEILFIFKFKGSVT